MGVGGDASKCNVWQGAISNQYDNEQKQGDRRKLVAFQSTGLLTSSCNRPYAQVCVAGSNTNHFKKYVMGSCKMQVWRKSLLQKDVVSAKVPAEIGASV